MDASTLRIELAGASCAAGAANVSLRVGNRHVRIAGLEPQDRATLRSRWGGFLEPERDDPPATWLEIVPSSHGFLELERPGEPYRLEARGEAGRQVLVSYNFVLAESDEPRRWRAAIHRDGVEPVGRILDNVLRYLVARTAIDLGGIALHAAAVLRERRAFVLAGASGAGKSTAAALSHPARSLGDDFAVLLPGTTTWLLPALPFDNSEHVADEPPRGVFPVAGVWRLLQADAHAVERPAPRAAIASLLTCTAFPWAMPELGDRILDHAGRLVSARLFAHLRFRPDAGFWPLLDAAEEAR